MGWMQRLFGQAGSGSGQTDQRIQALAEQMGPGLEGDYDRDLREKAGMHQPPTPPEYMGLEGEYDPQGLAKRVALALDRQTELEDIPSLQVGQEGSMVVFSGTVREPGVLECVSAVASRVDGAKAIDVSQVQVRP